MSHVEIISASAGTGKTTRLAKLIYEAVKSGEARPEAILATTFTKRAAAELAERARQRLLAEGATDAAHRLQAARIGTVNGVYGGIVADFAFLHGLSPRVSVMDERRAVAEPMRAASERLPAELRNELEELHISMGAASNVGLDSSGPWANFGARGWDWKLDALRIVTLARSNAMGPELFEGFAQRSIASALAFLAPPAKDGAAFDRALEDALKRYIDQVDTEVDSTQKTKKTLELARAARDKGVPEIPWSEWAKLATLDPGKKSQPLADPVREAAAAHDRHPRLHGDVERAIRAVYRAAAIVLESYQEHKRSLGVIDFVDQETEALALLQDPAVREQLAEEIDLVLVDEFQDTSPIQLAIFLELSKIARRSVWVGDPKQAIYGFRGADPALMDAAVTALLEGGSPDTLAVSYRSRPSLVRLTSDLFVPAFAESGIREELVRVEPGLLEEPEGLGPIIERWILEPGINEKTGKPQENAATKIAALAAGVCALLADPDARVRDPATGEARPIIAGDIAVLCFRNDQCTKLASALEARDVRAVVGRPGLVGTLEARLALAAVRLWIDPSNSLARAELARWLDPDQDAEAWLTQVLEAKDRDNLFADLTPVAALHEAREPRAFAGVLAAFDAALAAAGVRERAVTFGNATERLANLDALRAQTASYVDWCRAEGVACSLRGLLVYLDQLAIEEGDMQASADRPDAVRLCTMWGAKGLEWPVTVIADLTDRPAASALGVSLVSESESLDVDAPLAGRWLRYWPSPYGAAKKNVPFIERVGDDGSTQAAQEAARREALRLMYVAWTRARDRLVYAGTPGRLDEGALTVLAAGGEALLSEPGGAGASGESAEVSWGAPGMAHEIQVKMRAVTPARPDGGALVAARGYVPSGPRDHAYATVSPSQLESVGATCTVTEIGPRIPISVRSNGGSPDDDDEMRRFGDAVHGFLAADRVTLPPAEREALAGELLERFGMRGAVEAAQLPGASDRLAEWVESTWPGAVWRREWPLLHRLAEGTLLRGVADLVLEARDGLVVIDHKSFPGNREQAVERAVEYSGQLAAYGAALEAATERPVIGTYVHLPVSGQIVDVQPTSPQQGPKDSALAVN